MGATLGSGSSVRTGDDAAEVGKPVRLFLLQLGR